MALLASSATQVHGMQNVQRICCNCIAYSATEFTEQKGNIKYDKVTYMSPQNYKSVKKEDRDYFCGKAKYRKDSSYRYIK